MEEIQNNLSDPLWRLNNLYKIKRPTDGRLIKFQPRPEQQRVFELLLKEKCRRLIILKARRLGMSTGIDILLADQILWNAGSQCSIVDQSMADAERKLATIVKVAFDNLPPALRGGIKYLRDSGSVIEITWNGDAASSLFAGLRARGGTNNWLHLSEWGVIQADDPKRSEEILTGAIPSAEHGSIVVETTWKGGRGGHLWNLVKSAMETPDKEKTEADWRVVFFPWWRDPTYTLEGPADTISAINQRYLASLEAEIGQPLTPGQRLWYDRQEKNLGLFIYREFPSTVEECFKAPVEGAIYADMIDRLRSEGAIAPRPYDHNALVHTSWDLGSPVNTVCWYFQIVNEEIRVIDLDMNLDMSPVHRVAHMLGKQYPFGMHILPHDGMTTNTSGRTFANELQSAGLTNIRVVPRCNDIWVGINRLRQLLPRFTFRLPFCEHGLDALAAYHYKPVSATGLTNNEPVHDWSSHPSDALRMLAEAEVAGMLPMGGPARRDPVIVRTGFRDNIVVRR